MIDQLVEQIWSHEQFHEDYSALNKSHIGTTLGVNTNAVGLDCATRLLQCATHFSLSQKLQYREAAYRIAIASFHLFSSEANGTKSLVELILSRLGNFPAVDFLHSINGSSHQLFIPTGLWFYTEAHKLKNTRLLSAATKLCLTEFQVALWDALHKFRFVVVTAPTSAGKSFALQHYLCESFKDRSDHLTVYVAPTRALVNQVASSVQEIISNLQLNDVQVSTIPSTPEEIGSDLVLYVLTQERLQLLLAKNDHLNIARLVVDEAQMVGDDARGIVLQTVVERIIGANPEAHIFFGSPTTANPDIFSTLFSLQGTEQVQTSESPVAQNLIFVDTDPHEPSLVSVRARMQGTIVNLGKVNVGYELLQQDQILPMLAMAFGKREQNLVYANAPAACEDTSGRIVDLISASNEPIAEVQSIDTMAERLDFASFLRTQFHSEYYLATAIESGVAFHYGSMPATIRKGVEKLFSDGHLNYLVCTSTLLHGVNLPAKNMFLHNPSKGSETRGKADNPISSVEFWNLVGRAGRLKKDFEGNVFLIDERFWKAKPYDGDTRHSVRPSLFVHLIDRNEELFAFMSNSDHPSGERQGLENTFVKLFNDFRTNKLDETLSKLPSKLPQEVRTKLIDILTGIAAQVRIPIDICERHTNISVLRQQEMLNYLVEKIKAEGPKRVLPVHPSRYWQEVYGNIVAILKRIHTCFEKKPKADGSHTYYANLAAKWMRGETYAELINAAYELKIKRRKRSGPPSIATVIRNVFQEIENDLRFRYVKYTNCYIDVVKLALAETETDPSDVSIPSLPLYLELGASSETMISLLGMGISRASASVLSSHAPRQNMNRPETLRWISNTNWTGRNISRLTMQEIKDIVSLRG